MENLPVTKSTPGPGVADAWVAISGIPRRSGLLELRCHLASVSRFCLSLEMSDKRIQLRCDNYTVRFTSERTHHRARMKTPTKQSWPSVASELHTSVTGKMTTTGHL